jgi:outer membrane protein OmpA-like peptidoglycan-associated protein
LLSIVIRVRSLPSASRHGLAAALCGLILGGLALCGAVLPAGALAEGAVTGSPPPAPEVKAPLKPPKRPSFETQATPDRPQFPGQGKALAAPPPAGIEAVPPPDRPTYSEGVPPPVARDDLPARRVDPAAPPRPSVAAADPGERLQLDFAADAEALDSGAQAALAGVAERLRREPGRRLQVEGFAPVRTEGGENAARRLALRRALAVRSYLIEAGIAKERLVLYAKLAGTGDAATDRVEVKFNR